MPYFLEESMNERLDLIEKRYEEINSELLKSEVFSNINLSRELLKETSNIEDIVMCYRKYKKVLDDIKATKEMTDDPELSLIAKEELINLEKEQEKLERELELLLVPKDPNDLKDVIIEIRGAAGGDEANIFAGDLFHMYSKYAEKQGFKVEVINSMDGESGGFTLIEFQIRGDKVYSKFKYESGAHRVQRIPVTEANGRIQTSTATVLVMPEAESTDIDIKESDVRVDIYRSSGCGGQGVNTTDSAVRMTHLPTGIVVTCQNERSQIKNRERAFQVLKTRVYEYITSKKEQELGSERKSKIGTGDRSEKIRTYNYPQNRVTDHRINFSTMQLDRVMEGELDEIIEALIIEEQKRQLAGK